jgi:hypothetical protein
MTIATVRLKDGTEAPTPLVMTVVMALRQMADSQDISDILSLYELTMASRDPAHQFFGDYAERLAKRGLVDPGTGRPHQAVAEIVRNAVIGDDPGMDDWRIVSPLDLERQP